MKESKSLSEFLEKFVQLLDKGAATRSIHPVYIKDEWKEEVQEAIQNGFLRVDKVVELSDGSVETALECEDGTYVNPNTGMPAKVYDWYLFTDAGVEWVRSQGSQVTELLSKMETLKKDIREADLSSEDLLNILQKSCSFTGFVATQLEEAKNG